MKSRNHIFSLFLAMVFFIGTSGFPIYNHFCINANPSSQQTAIHTCCKGQQEVEMDTHACCHKSKEEQDEFSEKCCFESLDIIQMEGDLSLPTAEIAVPFLTDFSQPQKVLIGDAESLALIYHVNKAPPTKTTAQFLSLIQSYLI